MAQSHFSEDNSHFLLHSIKDRKPTIKRELDPTKKPTFHTYRVNTRKGVLSEKAERVKQISKSRKKIFQDERIYFVIQFSDIINNWKSIQSTLDSLGGKVTRVYGDTTVKIAIQPNEYEQFVEVLEQERSLIENVRESISSDKFDERFLHVLESRQKPQDVTIEVSDLSGMNYTTALTSALETFAQKKNEHIELGYSAKNFAIFSGKLSPKTITEIAEQVEVVESVEPLPKIALISYNDPIDENVELASIVSLSRETQQKDIPIICAIDGGINGTHAILQGNISDTYDFTTNSPKPCLDYDGHGSMVSGIVIYGGNTQTNTRVLSKILMVKGFENKSPVGNIMQMIDKSTSFFGKKTKVFNLSFSAFGPNRALSKMLDDLIYSRNLVLVACTGNIDYNQIENSMQNSNDYPDYLQKYPIFFPGDSNNIITVGANTEFDSNWVRRYHPSPFTRVGTDEEKIKPDVVFDGGNLNLTNNGNGTYSFNSKNVGVKSASFNDLFQLSEGAGTSFSSPAVATIVGNILQEYDYASPYLVKSLLLSSTNLLTSTNGEPFKHNIQGFGAPDLQIATQSTRWRVCYLIQETFDGTDPNEIHRYKFLFPNNADKVTLTFVVGRPPNSEGSFRYKLVKSGNKITSKVRPNYVISKTPIQTTHKAFYDVKRGGKGLWTFEVYPHFDKNIGSNKSLSYGCVVAVESTKNLDIFTPIDKWMKSEETMVQRAQEVVNKKLLEEAEIPNP